MARVTVLKGKVERKELSSSDTRRKILVGAFIKSQPGMWNNIVSSDGFDKYIDKPVDRKLFDLPELPKDVPTKTDEYAKNNSGENYEPHPGGGYYLDVPKEHKDTAKNHGAKWDNDAVKWYAPNGVDPGPIQLAVNEAIEASVSIVETPF